MSELAFNANGECFEVPASVTGWRVRRMKPRGAPELVYGRDGRPLMVPIECDMNDLRDAVSGVLGRYRLDPINDDGKVIDTVPAAYIQVVKPERNAGGDTSSSAPSRPPEDDTIREAMRLNTELAKAVIDRFPQMVEAAATLLRAADGAGLPARPPGAVVETDEEHSDDEPTAAGGFDLNALIAQVVPMIVMSLGSGKLKVPDLASVVDWRKAAKPAKCPVLDAGAPSTPAPSEKDEPAGLPPLAPATMAHFIAVQSALTPEEGALAREVAGELEPAQLRAWFDELSKLSVPDAVQKIRSLIGSEKGVAS
jgi:hypothetical protein